VSATSIVDGVRDRDVEVADAAATWSGPATGLTRLVAEVAAVAPMGVHVVWPHPL
jgi:hypothetical protein